MDGSTCSRGRGVGVVGLGSCCMGLDGGEERKGKERVAQKVVFTSQHIMYIMYVQRRAETESKRERPHGTGSAHGRCNSKHPSNIQNLGRRAGKYMKSHT
jgi:hypothetical protein